MKRFLILPFILWITLPVFAQWGTEGLIDESQIKNNVLKQKGGKPTGAILSSTSSIMALTIGAFQNGYLVIPRHTVLPATGTMSSATYALVYLASTTVSARGIWYWNGTAWQRIHDTTSVNSLIASATTLINNLIGSSTTVVNNMISSATSIIEGMIASSTAVTNNASSVIRYVTRMEFATSTNKWSHYFPANKWVYQPNWMAVTIGGAPYQSSVQILPASGPAHAGIQVLMNYGENWEQGQIAEGEFWLTDMPASATTTAFNDDWVDALDFCLDSTFVRLQME